MRRTKSLDRLWHQDAVATTRTIISPEVRGPGRVRPLSGLTVWPFKLVRLSSRCQKKTGCCHGASSQENRQQELQNFLKGNEHCGARRSRAPPSFPTSTPDNGWFRRGHRARCVGRFVWCRESCCSNLQGPGQSSRRQRIPRLWCSYSGTHSLLDCAFDGGSTHRNAPTTGAFSLPLSEA